MSDTTPRLLDDQLCFAFYNASKTFNHFYQEAMKPFHLTYPQYIAMLALWEKSPMTVRELGEHLNLDSGTLTPLLKRLESMGWVTRTRSQQDERHVNIEVTEFAQNQRDEVYSRVNACVDFLKLDGIDYDQFMKQINSVIGELNTINHDQLIHGVTE